MELYLNTYSTYIWYMVELLLDQVDVVEPPVPKQFADQLLLSHLCCSSEDFQVLNVASHMILWYLYLEPYKRIMKSYTFIHDEELNSTTTCLTIID